MFHKKRSARRGERIYFQVRTSDLCQVKGISAACLRRDIRLGRLNLASLEDIIRWVNKPRIRSNKGKPLTWLNQPKSAEN